MASALEKDLPILQNVLKQTLSKLDDPKGYREEIIASVMSLSAVRVQNLFYNLENVVRQRPASGEAYVEDICKKMRKHTQEEIKPLEVIIAMLLREYPLSLYGGIHKSLNDWCFDSK